MRRALALLVLTALATALSGCQSPTPMTIEITARDWNGWDQNHVPTPKTVTLKAEPGAETTVASAPFVVTIRVVEVSEGKVIIETSEPMAPANPGGGVNMIDKQRRFTVTTSVPAEFATATMDAGMNYEVKLRVDG